MSELSESDFRSIVDAVAADRSRIVSIVTTGFHLGFEVMSKRRKQRWQANCAFDPRTGDVTCDALYPSSGELRSFVEEVQRRIRGQMTH